MKTRILASALLIPFLVCLYFGGIALKVIMILIAAIAIDEMETAFEQTDVRPSKSINKIMFVLLCGLVGAKAPIYAALIWTIAALMASLCYGFNVRERKLGDITATALTSIYPTLFFATLILIDESDYGFMKWYVILIAFGTDIMAYFLGLAFGKHKLCPDLSPKKTREGAVGGVLGAVLFVCLFNFFVPNEMTVDWIILVIIAVIGSVISQLGDLAASSLKRQFGIKDYGKLIPGHGGIMDRFDSVLFVSPYIYFIVLLLSAGDIIF